MTYMRTFGAMLLATMLPGCIVVPFELATPVGTLSFFSTTTVFGTPVEVTLSEIAIEAFFPADEATGAALRMIVEKK